MKKLFKKKFIYLVLMLFVLAGINTGSVWADESVDYEEGVSNLNNTPENSAKIGNQLKKPEIGWKRYDDTHPAFHYEGDWTVDNSFSGDYNKVSHGSNSSDSNAKVKFTFTGSKLRIILGTAPSEYYSNKIEITIDGGAPEYFNANTNVNSNQILKYETTNLPFKTHTVEIKAINIPRSVQYSYRFDAIDIDSNGNLGEEITAESISLDKNEIELLEASQDKLTATVLPENATNKKIVWSSSDESIVTVDQEGNITAIKEGQATITAKVEGTDLTATCKVIVKAQEQENSNAILSITMVNGITKEYDVNSKVLNDYLSWFESASGTSTFKFSKTISPYKKVTEYLVHDKIASFEVREY